MNAPNPPKFSDERRSWLVRFQRSRASPDWLIEVQPIGAPDGGEQCYRFTSQQDWLEWCADVFEREAVEADAD